MSRAPVTRAAGRPRRLHCGHRVEAGETVTRKGGSWLCWRCQPWLAVPTPLEAARERARQAERLSG